MAKYLVAVDDEEVSAYAFTWALKNLFKPGDFILLITAAFSDATLPSADVASGEYAFPVTAEKKVESSAEVQAKATSVIEKFMKQCEEAELKSQGKVVDGSPGNHIVEEAKKEGVDAIVMGSHGRNVLQRTLLGSISDYVRHHTTLPVVLVRFPKEQAQRALDALESRRVIAAVDESPEAAHAFAWVLSSFLRDQDSLTVIHVQNPVAQPTAIGTVPVPVDQLGMEDVYVPPDTTAKASVEALGASEKLVESFMKQAAEKSQAKCEGRVVSGATQDKLLKEVEGQGGEVLVVGSHAKDVLQRTFLGSISDFMAHNSPCPVIFIKSSHATKPSVAAEEGKAHDV